MKASADFALCGRTPKSCSRHSDCARAQLTSGNQPRQNFVWPHRTGTACDLFYDFAPFRQLAANGGGIADTLEADAQQERSDKTNTSATNATPRPASIISRASGPCERLELVHEPAGVPSASAGLSTEIAQQLNALRIISGRQS